MGQTFLRKVDLTDREGQGLERKKCFFFVFGRGCALNTVSPPAGANASHRGHAEEPDDKYNQRARVTTGGYRGPHGEPLPEDGSVGRYDPPPQPSP